MTRDNWSRLSGQPLYDSKGQKMGDVARIFFGEATNEPAWVTVRSKRSDRETVVPLSSSKLNPSGLAVGIRGSQIKEAPSIAPDRELTADDIVQVDQHYQLGGAERAGADLTHADLTHAELTRFEEQLEIGAETFESGNARLHKSVETEPAEETVPLRHEKVRVEHVPVGDGRAAAHEFAEEDAVITLHDQRPIATKKTVPVETVRIAAEPSTEQYLISDEVRRERIDVQDESE